MLLYVFGFCLFLLFFFFKQKTAYEMLISDWSSDVCSFDLSHAVLMRAGSAARSSASRFNAVRGLRLPFERRRSATSASAASIVNDSTPPDRRCLPPTCTTRAPILSHCFNVCEALRSDT